MKITSEDGQVRIEIEIGKVWCYLDIEDGGHNYYAETRNGLDHDDIPEDAWEFSKTLKIDLTYLFWQAVADELECTPTLDALFEYTA